jgi:8-oxo-dGTP pyrophosphatase MutT (NUDIX family)
MEFCDVYDKYFNRTGKVIRRGDSLKKDEYNLVSIVWVKNEKDEFLISKRSKLKDSKERWETMGGMALVGENCLDTALREVKEEVGLNLKSENGKLISNPTFLYIKL